jgi:hypothetical protein
VLRAAANGLAPEWLRRAVKNGQRWAAAMTTALEELDQHYSQR